MCVWAVETYRFQVPPCAEPLQPPGVAPAWSLLLEGVRTRAPPPHQAGVGWGVRGGGAGWGAGGGGAGRVWGGPYPSSRGGGHEVDEGGLQELKRASQPATSARTAQRAQHRTMGFQMGK